MPDIYVNTTGIKSSSARLFMSAIRIASCAVAVKAVRNSLPFSSDVVKEIDRALAASEDSLFASKTRVLRMSDALSEAAGLYENTEQGRLFSISLAGLIKFRQGLIPHLTDSVTDTLWESAIGGSVVAGTISGGVSIFGTIISTTASGSLLNYSANGSVTRGTEYNDDGSIERMGIGAEGEFSANLAEGVISGNTGNLSGTISGSVGNVVADGEIGVTIFSDGTFAPAIYGGTSISGSVLSGSANLMYGNDEMNASLNASGEVLSAEVYAKGGIGVIQVEDADGNVSTEIGVQGEVGAEGYIAQGTISGGFEIFGIEINASATGNAGGAGFKAGGSATTGGVSGELGFGLGIGGNISFDIDWSGFDGAQAWDALTDAGEAVGEFIGDASDAVGDFFDNLF